MHNTDSYLQTFLFAMNFAQAYGDTTYGGGTYNESPATTTPAPSPTPATRTTQPTQTNQTTAQDAETPTSTSDDTPLGSTNDTPRTTTTTTQPASQDSAADETATIIDATPMWAIIAAVIALSAFAALLVVIVKKLSNR
jgi:hypothetical protein